MGERVALGVVAVLVVCGLGGAAAPAVSAAPSIAPAAPAEWQPTYDIDPNLADKLVAETPRGVVPDALEAKWLSCGLTMNIDYSVEPGIDAAVVRDQLAYPVRYFQALGYTAAIGLEVPYEGEPPVPTVPGEILVVVEKNSKKLKDNRWLAVTTFTAVNSHIQAARIIVDEAGGLSSDVLLHELGHVAGLPHKHGSVMDIPAPSAPIHFDAQETAAIDCR